MTIGTCIGGQCVPILVVCWYLLVGGHFVPVLVPALGPLCTDAGFQLVHVCVGGQLVLV